MDFSSSLSACRLCNFFFARTTIASPGPIRIGSAKSRDSRGQVIAKSKRASCGLCGREIALLAPPTRNCREHGVVDREKSIWRSSIGHLLEKLSAMETLVGRLNRSERGTGESMQMRSSRKATRHLINRR
jgi:hypothetical protein